MTYLAKYIKAKRKEFGLRAFDTSIKISDGYTLLLYYINPEKLLNNPSHNLEIILVRVNESPPEAIES